MDLKDNFCKGCGAKIQFESPSMPGYIPREVFIKRMSEGKEILCQMCFQLKHYSKLKHVVFPDKDSLDNFRKLMEGFENILWVIDMFDFEGSFRKELVKLLEGKRIIYVVNKIDLIPKAVSRKEIFNWVFEKIRDDQIYLVSVTKGLGIESLFRRLRIMNGKILIVGCTNVGKSSLLNKLCGTGITVSPFPNTTFDLVKAELPDSDVELFDTPGFSFEDRFTDLLSFNCQKKILPKTELKRKTFTAILNRVYFFGALVRIRVKDVENEKVRFQLFAPENVVLHDTKPERVEELLKKQVGKFLTPPCKPKELSMDSLKWVEKSIIIKEGQEIVFPGIGWLSMKKGSAEFEVIRPAKTKIFVRDALINPNRRIKT